MDIRNELVDELLASAGHPGALFGPDGLLSALSARLIERATEAEMTRHLRQERQVGRSNTRNGHTPRRLISARGPLDVSMPRDRAGSFTPALVPKYLRRLPDFDEKVLLLYAQGLSTRDIQAHLKELYGTHVSPDLVSEVTDTLIPLVQAWQARPLPCCFVVLFIDAIFVKVRIDGHVETRPMITVLGIDLAGEKQVLGLWLLRHESASAYAQVLTDLQARGVEDVLVVATDGIPGADEAVTAIFPMARHQHCLVHQMRASLRLVAQKDRKAVAASLKAIYAAPTEAEAQVRLDEAQASWGECYGAVFVSWRRVWPSLMAYYALPVGLRSVLRTTNAVEAVHRVLRSGLKRRGALPSETAVLKLGYAMIERLSRKWTRPVGNWPLLVNQLVLREPERLEPFLARTQLS